jgi:hypothetical protein
MDVSALTDEQRDAVERWARDGFTFAEVLARAAEGHDGVGPFEPVAAHVEAVVADVRSADTAELLARLTRDPEAVIRANGLRLIAELQAEAERIISRAESGRARWDELNRAGKLQQQAQHVAKGLPPANPDQAAPASESEADLTRQLVAAHRATHLAVGNGA